MSGTTESDYSYPLRASEAVGNMESLLAVKPLELSLDEKVRLKVFEEGLFTKYERATHFEITEHTIYPGAFTTEEGKKLFTDIYLGGKETPRLGEVDAKDIERIFMEADLSKIPKDKREKAHDFSYEWAKNKFTEELIASKGDVGGVENPVRIKRVVDPEDLAEEIKNLRILKAELKKEISQSGNNGDFFEGQSVILNIYRKRVNVALANLYENEGVDSRKLERIDHFLNGIGSEFNAKGMFESIPGRLRQYASKRKAELPIETPEYRKFNSVLVNSGQAKVLAEMVLNEYGLNSGDRKWNVVIEDGRSTLAVQYKSGSDVVRKIAIPKNFERGLVDTLTVLAHEIEGHVLRHVNKELAGPVSLKLFEQKSMGRTGILSEGAAMYIEGKTQEMVAGMKGRAEPYFFTGLESKMAGGSFKDVFLAIADLYSERNFGVPLKSLFEDKDKFQEAVDNSFRRAMRIFRRNTPLTDASGYAPTSDAIDYIEQETVLDFLMSEDNRGTEISNLVYVAGLDLFSVFDLEKLGLLDLTKVEEPKMVTAKVVWPKIKAGLAAGQNIGQILHII
ncbi:MAG: hypothetical protein ABSE04_04245 [Candidatus Microgenomates bacterium]|jgi:hypothetical protein